MKDRVPGGWELAALRDLVEPRTERVSPQSMPDALYIGMEHVQPHTNRLLATVPASTMASNAARFFEGDVLYGRMRPYLNKVVSPSFDGLASAEFIVFPKNEVIDSRFLLKRLSSYDFTDFALTQYQGDRPRVKFEQLGNFAILVPPAAEQARIVEKLEELLFDLDAGLAELRKAQSKLLQYRQSLLKSAAEGDLTADWRVANGKPQETGAELLQRILSERRASWEKKQLTKFAEQGKTPPRGWQTAYSEPASAVTSGLRSIPKGWVWATAEQLCDFITKGTTPPKSILDTSEERIPFLRVTNLTSTGELDFSEKVFVTRDIHEGFLARSIVYPRDVLMNIVGPPLGQVSIVPPSFEEWNINQAIAVFRAVKGVLPAFIATYLLSNTAQRWLKARAKTTAGQTNLTLETCRSLPVPLPPLQEQQALTEQLDAQLGSLAVQLTAVNHGVSQASAQRKNLLKAAFAGQLVPQDPNDEPASELLARIRAARDSKASGSIAGKRGRKPKVTP